MSKNIIKATGAVLFINLFVKLMGFIRETVIANAFGASVSTDAYLVAYTIPYFLQWVLGAALVAAIVPVLTKELAAGKQEDAWYVGSAVLNWTIIGMTVLTLLGFIFSTVLIKVLAPGFDPEVTALAVHMTRIMLPSAILMSAALVLTGILNASYKFAIPAFAPGFSTLILIAGIMLGAAQFGVDVLAWATLLSYVGFLLIQIPSLHAIGFRYQFVLGTQHAGVRQVLAGVLPIALSVAVNQIYFALNRVFASGLAEGSISALNYGNKLMMLPLGIFVAAIAATIYPALSELALKDNKAQMAKSLERGIGVVSLISIPAVVGLIVLRVPIVQLLFERGAFDHAATLATASALLFFTVGLLPMAINMVLTRAYYSLGDTKTPVKVGLLSILVNLALSVALFRLIPHGGGGLALANSLAALFNTIWLYLYLKKHLLKDLTLRTMLISLAKMAIGAVIMGAVVAILAHFLAPMGLIVTVGGCVVAGCLVYLVAVFVLKTEEVTYFKELVAKRLAKKLTK